MVQEPARLDVLIVDDDAADANFLLEAFRTVDPGLRVEHAYTGLVATTLLEGVADAHLPWVVLDVHLGPEYGPDLLEAWRERPAWHAMEVAIMTSSREHRDVENARAAHATRYYLKPSTWEEFVAFARDFTTSIDRASAMPEKVWSLNNPG